MSELNKSLRKLHLYTLKKVTAIQGEKEDYKMYKTEKQFANLWKPSTNKTPVDDAWNRKPIIYDGFVNDWGRRMWYQPFFCFHSFTHSSHGQ